MSVRHKMRTMKTMQCIACTLSFLLLALSCTANKGNIVFSVLAILIGLVAAWLESRKTKLQRWAFNQQFGSGAYDMFEAMETYFNR